MSDQEKAERNLKSVQRIDPKAIFIITQATHVALYRYDSDVNGWCKDEVEGSLFVYLRSEEPRYAFMIANRMSITDLVVQVTPDLDLQNQAPYVFLRKSDGTIRSFLAI